MLKNVEHWHDFPQAMGTNFTVLAASEVNEDYRSFFLGNHPGRFQHVFSSIEDQLHGNKCILCQEKGVNCPPHGCTSSDEVNLLITGSPCDPFSLQRSKRFAAGSVKMHCDFETTMNGVTQAYVTYKPVVGVMEQVSGFLMPFEAGGTETPFSRPGGSQMQAWKDE